MNGSAFAARAAHCARSRVMAGLLSAMLSSTVPENTWKSCSTTPTRCRRSRVAIPFTSAPSRKIMPSSKS